jgi:Uma2 family endonuclease
MENTISDYVNFEQFSKEKHEFVQGWILAMAGGTVNHALLGQQVAAELDREVRGGPCRVHNSELRVRIPNEEIILYPDASIICGPAQTDHDDENAVTNPTVIVEVTSPSTAKFDRGQKFVFYQAIPSLREYVLVSHAERLIEVFRRSQDGTWELATRGSSGDVHVESMRCVLNVDAIYAGTTGL